MFCIVLKPSYLCFVNEGKQQTQGKKGKTFLKRIKTTS